MWKAWKLPCSCRLFDRAVLCKSFQRWMEAWVKAKRYLEGNGLWKETAQAWDNGKNNVVLTTTREAKGRKIKEVKWVLRQLLFVVVFHFSWKTGLADSSQRAALVGWKLRNEPLIFTQSFSPSQYADSKLNKTYLNLLSRSSPLCSASANSRFSVSQNKW